MLNPTASIQQVLEYTTGPCSCRQKQPRPDQPETTYEELLAEALHDLRKGSPAKAALRDAAGAEKAESARMGGEYCGEFADCGGKILL